MPNEDEMVAESQVVEHTNTHLTADENELLKALLRPGASIDAVIPADPDPNELWQTLTACVHGMGLLEQRVLRLRPIIGRILMIFESKPSLYKALGYETFREFMFKGVCDTLKLQHTARYQALAVAKKWPQITPDRYANGLGPKKIDILNKFTDGKNRNAEQWLDRAEHMTVNELRQYCEQRSLVAPGETVGATIVIQTNRSILGLWKQAKDDGRVHSIVGSKDPGKILEAMLQNCYTEWIQQYDDKRAAEREERRKKAYAVEQPSDTSPDAS